ncbi:NlpC/P60 family protein [Hahella aquimaris]|uniref:C40 family peptidase n=1 Tax=Hahella sp. HNIBRBA332 TaxID=3015983 RepID=UPI00273C71D3|nr:NlpC/P60 family protein [Hahella sp. HNIBRBA332]WLQ12720.1 NlpC/P60 family protein [Hahella sp. HNIBRBA332]
MRISGFILITILMAFASGCSSVRVNHPPTAIPSAEKISSPVAAALYDQYDEWRGVDYRYGGLDKSGVDCSGLVYLTFQERFDAKLPRTTKGLAQKGRQVSRKELQPGDLVFFKPSGWKGLHVGIYVENNRFLHASTSNGVELAYLHNGYWADHFWQARRVK